jgi:hypothetical protein
MSVNTFIQGLKAQAQAAGLSEIAYYQQQLALIQAGGPTTVVDNLITAATNASDSAAAAQFTADKTAALTVHTPPAPIPIITSDPVSPAVGDSWLLQTPPHLFTQYIGTFDNGTLSAVAPGATGALNISITNLDNADRAFMASHGITGVNNNGTSRNTRLKIFGTGGAVTFSPGAGAVWTFLVAEVGGTVGDMVNDLNAWAVANLHAGIGTIATLTVPGDASVVLIQNDFSNQFTPAGDAIVEKWEFSVQSTSGPRRVTLV